MAHSGKYFPVHFRRDFSYHADCQNIGMLAKGYTITLAGDNSVPSLLNGRTFHLQDIGLLGPDTLQWLSPAVDIGIWFWQVRLRVRIVQLVDVMLQATWQLERDAITVSIWQSVGPERFHPVQRGPPLFGTVLFTDFTTFTNGANFNFSAWGPTGYPP